MKHAIDFELTVHPEPTKQMHLGAHTPVFSRGRSSADVSYGSIHDDATNTWSTLAAVEDVWNVERTLFARIGLDEIMRYCKGPVSVEFRLGNEKHNGTWDSSQVSETRSIDFSK